MTHVQPLIVRCRQCGQPMLFQQATPDGDHVVLDLVCPKRREHTMIVIMEQTSARVAQKTVTVAPLSWRNGTSDPQRVLPASQVAEVFSEIEMDDQAYRLRRKL